MINELKCFFNIAGAKVVFYYVNHKNFHKNLYQLFFAYLLHNKEIKPLTAMKDLIGKFVDSGNFVYLCKNILNLTRL